MRTTPAVFARSPGRMMLIVDDRPDLVTVKPHPKAPEYKRLLRYEKDFTAGWRPGDVYRPGQSPMLDLFERSRWAHYYPDNLQFAR